MKNNLNWADVQRQDELHRIQDGFARLTGTAIWFVEDGKPVKYRSLSRGSSKSLLVAADQVVFTMGEENTVAELVYEEDTFYIGRRSVFYDKERVGSYIFMTKKTDSVTEEVLEDQAECFMEFFYEYVEREKKLFSLGEALKAHKKIEHTMEMEKARLQLENDYDELTGVHSRTYFYKKLDEIEKREDALPVSLIVGDVNNLKFTNDMFGHRHGDLLLCGIADVLMEQAAKLKEESGKEIIIGRCGGDEFNIIMPNAQRRDANYYCHLVTEALKKETSLCLTPSISLGTSKKTEMSQSLNRLLETADAKMYAVKREYKQELDQFEEIMEVLYARRYLSRSLMEEKEDMITKFTKYLGWKEETVANCRKLMRYQDVGLTIVPESIGRKQGNYTERQWREIKKHPQLGMKLALIRPDLAPISEMMYQTHENYDGSGYPRKIAGYKIMPEVMAVRLVNDYLDYRVDNSDADSCAFIETNKEKVFEPDMADEFINYVSRK